ncbi:methyltransferase domain-containing protein [Agromyces sp. NPDC058484]|uniref:methyltransferase domain-containing protein n=1 Tax=Agromyces sp. NPDC058484 TaxID=3346524 RepID=UPI00364B9C05
MTETFQITPEQAEAYEEFLVPALTAQWTDPMLDIAGVAPGQRVLDVACGTGVLARAAARRVGSEGHVVGVDLNPAMIDVARRLRPDLEWRQGDAAVLPFDDDGFDAVLCQASVFFFPDVPAAIAEMARVARAGGVVAIQTFAGLDDQPVYGRFIETVLRHSGEDARSLIDTYFSQGDLPALRATFERAGLRVERVSSRMGVAAYGSWEDLIETEVKNTPLVDRFTDDQIGEIRAESEDLLRRHQGADGSLNLPIRAHLIAGRLP